MTLGERIYSLRTGQGMTQEQLAERMGVSRQSVSKWETDSAVPDIEKLKLLTEILGVSIAELLGMEENDGKKKENAEQNEKKEIERLKSHKKALIAIIIILAAVCVSIIVYARILLVKLPDNSKASSVQTTQVIEKKADDDDQIGNPKGLISEFDRSIEYSSDGKLYLKLKCVLVKEQTDTKVTGIIKKAKNEEQISVNMEKKENTYTGSVEITESFLKDPVRITINIDNNGESQNVRIDTDAEEYLLDSIDWLPTAELEEDEVAGARELQSGYLNIRASQEQYMKDISDVKIRMNVGKKKVFEKKLSAEEWKELKKSGEMGYAYEFTNDETVYDNYTDGDVTVKIQYYNKTLKKKITIWCAPLESADAWKKIEIKDS